MKMRGEVRKVKGFNRFPYKAVEHIMLHVLDAGLSALFNSSR